MSTKLRKEAKGRPCMVRVPEVCTGGGEDTVLAHYRLAGYCGTGLKPDDWMGAWCCYACHDAIDGRNTHGIDHTDLRLFHAEGVLRTQQQLKKEGKI